MVVSGVTFCVFPVTIAESVNVDVNGVVGFDRSVVLGVTMTSICLPVTLPLTLRV